MTSFYHPGRSGVDNAKAALDFARQQVAGL
jgi:hypothetical protein